MGNEVRPQSGVTYQIGNFGGGSQSGNTQRSRTHHEAMRDAKVGATQARAVGALSQLDRDETIRQFDYMASAIAERQDMSGVEALLQRLQDKQVVYDTAMIEVYRRLVQDYKIDPK